MEDILIVGAARTAIGKFGGSLAKLPAAELGALVIRKVLERAGVAPEQVSEVIMGQVLTAATGQNPARQAAIRAGLPDMIPAMTINKVCGSGLKAAMLGAQSIAHGDADLVVAGGQESMSMSPPAGNASGINDGAAAVVLASSKKAKELGLKPIARIKAFASAGVDPKYMGMGPVPASKRCLSRAGWEPKDLDLMEINEAFAAQAIAVNRQMGWDTKKVNVNGGAIALGHPIGASGCRILVTLLHEMQKRDAKRGLASLCIGGGMGVALAVER